MTSSQNQPGGYTKEFLRVYRLLITAAEHRGLVTYSRIADILGLPHQGSNTGRLVGQILGDITTSENAAGRPMLSAVAVSSTNWKPGKGFAGLAHYLGKLPTEASASEVESFWRKELERVYAEWGS